MAMSSIFFFSAAAWVMNTVSVFRWLSGTGEEKVDPDKAVVFTYDGVLAHLDGLAHRFMGFYVNGFLSI